MAGNDGELQTDEATKWSTITARVKSFRHFPRTKEVSAERLARAGFYFTGELDRVRCFSCQQTVENWSSADTPVKRHLQASPACQFLKCVHRTGSSDADPLSNGSVYDEAAEALEFRLRTGEVVDESTYPMTPEMCVEDARIRSFGTLWPASAPVRPRQLAEAGLYYLGQDKVQCFCCGGMLAGWEPGDEPWSEHSRHFPNCFFILGHDVGNVPSTQPPESGPRVPMESFEERLGSFAGRQHPVDHERLARAGFYSSGASDGVKCFQCGGGLKDWQPEEDPWEQHAKYYPGCSFLLSEKGNEFVNSIQLQCPSKSNSASSHHQNGFSKQERATNIMQSEIAQKAVEMGFDPVKVERAILEKIRLVGQGYSSVEDLIQDVLSNPADNDPEGSHAHDDENPMEKLEKLQREKQCKVCMDSDACMVFVPCGHLATCKRCADSLHKCPICCAEIIQKIKTYIS